MHTCVHLSFLHPLPQSGFEAPAAQVSASVMALSLEWQSLGINHFAEDCFSDLGSFLVPCEFRMFFFLFFCEECCRYFDWDCIASVNYFGINLKH